MVSNINDCLAHLLTLSLFADDTASIADEPFVLVGDDGASIHEMQVISDKPVEPPLEDDVD